MLVVPKKRVLFARFLVTAAPGGDMPIPARLCLEDAVVGACAIRRPGAMGVELAVSDCERLFQYSAVLFVPVAFAALATFAVIKPPR